MSSDASRTGTNDPFPSTGRDTDRDEVASTSSRTLHDEPQKESLIRRRVPFLFSVRFGITAWYAGVLILTIAIVGIGFRIMIVRTLERQTDDNLTDAVGIIRNHLVEQPAFYPADTGYLTYQPKVIESEALNEVRMSNVSVAVYDFSTYQLVWKSGAYAEYWPGDQELSRLLDNDKRGFMTQRVGDSNVRVLAYPIYGSQLRNSATGGPQIIGMIFAMESLSTTTEFLDELNQVLLLSGIVGAGVASVGGWVLAGRALAPVNRIMSSAEDIANDRSAASLSRRLEVPNTGDEIAQLAETFNDMLDRIEQAFAAQRRFVADASHELRTPLTSIKGNIDVLRRQIAAGRPLDPQDISDALGDVARESARMSRLVEDLLSLARNESAGYATTSDMHPTSLDILAGEAIRTAEVLVKGQKLKLDARKPVELYANGDQLVQVMLILLDNALRHTPPGGSVTLRVSEDVDPIDEVPCARIDVEDTGQGIDREHLPHLFERFYRAENARDRTSGGTGLGLAIALSIVRAHGGWIDVESAPEQGTRFTVWLPLRDAPSAPQETNGGSRLIPRMPRRKSNG